MYPRSHLLPLIFPSNLRPPLLALEVSREVLFLDPKQNLCISLYILHHKRPYDWDVGAVVEAIKFKNTDDMNMCGALFSGGGHG